MEVITEEITISRVVLSETDMVILRDHKELIITPTLTIIMRD